MTEVLPLNYNDAARLLESLAHRDCKVSFTGPHYDEFVVVRFTLEAP